MGTTMTLWVTTSYENAVEAHSPNEPSEARLGNAPYICMGSVMLWGAGQSDGIGAVSTSWAALAG